MNDKTPNSEKKPAAENQAAAFARQAEESPPGLVAEFWDFLLHNKSWWITPIVIVLLLFGAFVFFSATPLAPFIYTVF